jgi:hypothetical protein
LLALRQRLLKASIDGAVEAAGTRRAQLSIRQGRRDYDRNIAGLGMGRAPRYFVFDLERIADRLFGVSQIANWRAISGCRFRLVAAS